MNNLDAKITVLGLGGAGCRILRELNKSAAAAKLSLLAVDTDSESLAETGLPPESLIQAGKEWRSGQGCGGDELFGQRSIARERSVLQQRLADTSLLIVTGGLGGGVGSGGAPVIFGVACKLKITSIALFTRPFSMEGYRRQKLADEVIAKELLPRADAVITLPNDLLFATLPGETPIATAYELAAKEMVNTILSLSVVLTAGNLFSADFAALTGMFHRKGGNCVIGAGCADLAAGESVEQAMERALLSPLLGGINELVTANNVIFTVTGGPNLSLAEAKRALDLANAQLPPDPGRVMLLGAATLPEWDGKIQITALAVHYTAAADTPLTNAAAVPETQHPVDSVPHTRRRGGEKGDSNQMLLPNFELEDKGIMENTTQVSYGGEDLDIPTFKRRNIVID